MIRVNLLQGRMSAAKTQVGMMGGGTATDFAATSAGATGIGYTTSGANNKNLAINIAVILIVPVALIYYERSNLDDLRQRAQVVADEVQVIQNEITAKKEEITQSANLKEKAKELANKIEILKKLARLRLREIKALDYIQTNIPEKVWLKELAFRGGALTIRGYAVTDDELTNFVRSLEKSRNFSGVVLLQAREERNKDGAVKNFEVSCTVEAE